MANRAQKKHQCEVCPAKNRGVIPMIFAGKRMLLCLECRKIAQRKNRPVPLEPSDVPVPKE